MAVFGSTESAIVVAPTAEEAIDAALANPVCYWKTNDDSTPIKNQLIAAELKPGDLPEVVHIRWR